MTDTERKYYLLGQAVRMRLIGQTEPGEPVAYLYGEGKVRLPKLPETDLPYAVIVKKSNETYRLIFTAEEVSTVYNSGVFISTTNTTFVSYDLTNGEWVQGNYGSSFLPAIWTNHNLDYHETEDNAGDLYLAASEPIPVYE